jgi:hypothetical protein
VGMYTAPIRGLRAGALRVKEQVWEVEAKRRRT